MRHHLRLDVLLAAAIGRQRAAGGAGAGADRVPPAITVSGEATVSVAPDLAQVEGRRHVGRQNRA